MKQAKEVTTMEDFEELLEKSEAGPVILFKYSPVCPVSHWAEDQFKEFSKMTDLPENLVLARVDVIGSRPVARGIVPRIGVEHQSPQALLFSGKECLWHANHTDITAASLQKSLTNTHK